MKITRRQLRKLIKEAIEAGPRGVLRVPKADKSPAIVTDKRTKDRFHGTAPKKALLPWEKLKDGEYENLQSLLHHDDESFKEMGYDISDTALEAMPGTTKAAFEDEEYSRKRQRVYKQGVNFVEVTPPYDSSIIYVAIPYELIDLVVDAWQAWEQNPATKAQFSEALNTYYDYIDARLPIDIRNANWYEPDIGHYELEKALAATGEVL